MYTEECPDPTFSGSTGHKSMAFVSVIGVAMYLEAENFPSFGNEATVETRIPLFQPRSCRKILVAVQRNAFLVAMLKVNLGIGGESSEGKTINNKLP